LSHKSIGCAPYVCETKQKSILRLHVTS
jgi:hypothetical protein